MLRDTERRSTILEVKKYAATLIWYHAVGQNHEEHYTGGEKV